MCCCEMRPSETQGETPTTSPFPHHHPGAATTSHSPRAHLAVSGGWLLHSSWVCEGWPAMPHLSHLSTKATWRELVVPVSLPSELVGPTLFRPDAVASAPDMWGWRVSKHHPWGNQLWPNARRPCALGHALSPPPPYTYSRKESTSCFFSLQTAKKSHLAYPFLLTPARTIADRWHTD